tara:strand:+ start:6789 stop:10028 length:3240 start_codon:yes stop_codon:yes gene_type:complete
VSSKVTTPCPDAESLLSFLNSESDAATIDSIDRHIDECGDCATLIAEFARLEIPEGTVDAGGESEQFGSLCRGDTLGRYLVLDLLGQGAMGSVYAAYDNELDRKVALKVLRQSNWSGLVREGRALASLTHPNIVTVHDLGSADSRSFIAMEFVDGTTLREWLTQSRTWQEIVAIFLQAGDALAAAHNAGIVHRDFKPDNMLIDGKGKASVADFGLARAVDSADVAPEEIGAMFEATEQSIEAMVTRTGVLLGTPAYMAPEQLRGEIADDLSDQYSFCVAFFEALYKERPFFAKSAKGLYELQMSSEASLRGKAQVPSWIGQALLRGLARDPASRHPSMGALVSVLRTDPRKVFWRRLKVAGVLGTITILAGLAFMGLGNRADAAKLCESSGSEMAETWGEPSMQALAARFDEIDTPHARDVLARLRARFGGFSQEWASARDQACADTRIRGVASEDSLEQRMYCFERHRQEFQILLTAITKESGPDDFVAMIEAVNDLPRSSDCRDVNRPEFRVPLPASDADRERVQDIDDKLVELTPTHWTKMNTADIAEVALLISEAKPLGYAPLLARAFVVQHELYRLHENDAAALAAARAGIVAATEAKNNEGIARWMLYFLSRKTLEDAPLEEFDTTRFFVGNAVQRAGNTPELRARFAMAQARHSSIRTQEEVQESLWNEAVSATEGIGSLKNLRAQALSGLGQTLIGNGHTTRGLDHVEQAIDVLTDIHGQHSPLVIAQRGKVAHARVQSGGDPRAAIGDLQLWVEQVRSRHGDTHRAMLGPMYYLAQVLSWAGEFTEAEQHMQKAIAIARAQPGKMAETLATMQFELSEVYQGLGNFEAGEKAAQLGLEILIEGVGKSDSRTTEAYIAAAYAAQGRGKLEKATQLLDEAFPALANDSTPLLRIYWHWVRGLVAEDAEDFSVAEDVYRTRIQSQAELGENSLGRIDTLVALGDVLRKRGKYAAALQQCEQARELAKAHLSAAEHHSVIAIGGCMGKTLRALGREDEALPFLEQAVLQHSKRTTRQRPVSVGETHLVLARALQRTDPDRARAILVAELAQRFPSSPAERRLRTQLGELFAQLK